MKQVLVIGFIILFGMFYSGCDTKETTNEEANKETARKEAIQKADEQKKTILEKVSELSLRYDAIVNWPSFFMDADENEFYFTAHLQEILLPEEKKPFIFVGHIFDISKTEKGYTIHALQSVGFTGFYLLLECNNNMAKRLLNRKQSTLDWTTYVLAVNVDNVRRPMFQLMNAHCRSEDPWEECYVDFEADAPASIIVVTGKCLETAFIGNFDGDEIEWWDAN